MCVTRTLCLPNVYLMCTQRVPNVLGHWLLKMCVRQPEENGAKAHFRKGHQVPRWYSFSFHPFFLFCAPQATGGCDGNGPKPHTLNPKPEAVPDIN